MTLQRLVVTFTREASRSAPSTARSKDPTRGLRGCADRLDTFHIFRFSEPSNRLPIVDCHIRYPPIRASSKARTREVTDLVRTGLQDALTVFEAGAECVGTSGFTTREDVLLATTSPNADGLAKGA